MTDTSKLPTIRFPGRLIVKGTLTYFDPKGIPFNIECTECIVDVPSNAPVGRQDDTVVEGSLGIRGQVYFRYRDGVG